MLSNLKTDKRLVGVKQSVRAIRDGTVLYAYIAEDADVSVTRSVAKLCEESQIEVITVPTMKELGLACDIDVGAAVAVLLKG